MRHEEWLSAWRPVSRTELFVTHRPKRLCVTIDGGIGKTTSLLWSQANAHCQPGHDRRLYFYVHFRDLPSLREQVLDFYPVTHNGTTIEKPGRLVELFIERLSPNRDATPTSVHDHLRRLIRNGQIVFLIDGLDQTRSEFVDGQRVNLKVKALADFLRRDASNCDFVIAGRPHSVTTYWTELFEGENWQFAMIDGFNDEERKAYLGDKHKHIEKLDAETLSIPRMLEAIRQVIPISKLEKMETTSELYSEVVHHTWEQDKPTDTAGDKLPKDRALLLLGAIAFEMFSHDANWDGVSAAERAGFLDRIWQTRHAVFGSRDPHDAADRKRWDAEILKLGESNSLIDYCFLDGDEQLTDIYFRDTTIQEFFVAHWLAHHATIEDSQLLGETPYLPSLEQPNRENLYRIWRFLAEMPQPKKLVWLRSISSLFVPHPKQGLRSCEIMYRAYRFLDAIANEPPTGFRGVPEHVVLAQEILIAFHNEFSVDILEGHRGMDAQRIAEEFIASFVPIPRNYRGPSDLRFWSGANEEQFERGIHWWLSEPHTERNLSQSFEMADCLTTNELYQLFESNQIESNHKRRTQDTIDSDEVSKHPVVSVSWYQATMFCHWLNRWLKPKSKEKVLRFRLPDEWEWEFAARAGTETLRFFCSDSVSGSEMEELTRKFANFGYRLRHTSKVGSLYPNPWGLFDVLGNAWELTSSSVDGDSREWTSNSVDGDRSRDAYLAIHRVARGAAWADDIAVVRCSMRSFMDLEGRNDITGFRVSRALENS